MELRKMGEKNGLPFVEVAGDEPTDGEVWTNEERLTYAEIRALCGTDPYTMELANPDAEWVVSAVNQGIDAHLEACFVPVRGDNFFWKPRLVGRVHCGMFLHCIVSPTSLPTLLRRLMELDAKTEWDDSAGSPSCLVDAILETMRREAKGDEDGE